MVSKSMNRWSSGLILPMAKKLSKTSIISTKWLLATTTKRQHSNKYHTSSSSSNLCSMMLGGEPLMVTTCLLTCDALILSCHNKRSRHPLECNIMAIQEPLIWSLRACTNKGPQVPTFSSSTCQTSGATSICSTSLTRSNLAQLSVCE